MIKKSRWESLGRVAKGALSALALLACCTIPSSWSANAESDAFPLQPADISSPRDTLQSFLANTTAVFEAINAGHTKGLSAYRYRLQDTLDFSATPNSHLMNVQTLRMVYLKEILDRIKLPAVQDIPGDETIATTVLPQWIIPGTRIAITRVREGEHAGNYVFSAESVANLHRYFQQVKTVPYQPGATKGFYKIITAYTRNDGNIASRIRSRLTPLNAASPRELIQSFLGHINSAYEIVMNAKNSRPPMTTDQAKDADRQARSHFNRAMETLDLGSTPIASRNDKGIEVTLLLKEILDRAPLPPLDSIPSALLIKTLREQGKSPIRWRLPNTNLEVVELTEGPSAGEFRFSIATVVNAEKSYSKVRDLPYRGANTKDPDENRFTDQYDSPETSPQFYEYYISTPGRFVPAASPIWPVLKRLPASANTIYAGQTVWQWVGILVTVFGVIMAFFAIHTVGRWLYRHVRTPLSAWTNVLQPVANATVALWATNFLDSDVNITGAVNGAVLLVGGFLLYAFAAATAFRTSSAIADTVVYYSKRDKEDFDSSLLRVSTRAIGFVVGAVILVNGVRQLGLDLIPLVAGLGVGGLAVALAIRPTLENMIGGIVLYADRPVQVGDFCSFGANKGVIQRIGLRSTRIRAPDRTMITIPNSAFADMQITNWAMCDTILINTVIGLRYETTPDQLRHLMAKMRQTCFAHPLIQSDTLRIRFAGFGTSSLDIAVRVYVLTTEWNEFHAVREDLFLRFADLIEESGTRIAHPSTTVYMGKDSDLDTDTIAAVEQEVQAWREADELPYPLTPEPLAKNIENTLDYPPKGSPGYAHKAVAEKRNENLSSPERSGKT